MSPISLLAALTGALALAPLTAAQTTCVETQRPAVIHTTDVFTGGATAIAVSGDRAMAVVADVRSSDNLTTYERVNGDWAPGPTLPVTAPAGLAFANFVDIDLEDDLAVVTYRFSPTSPTGFALVRTFQHDGTAWQPVPAPETPDGAGDFAGRTRALFAGRDLIIASPSYDHANAYKLIQGSWTLTQSLDGNGRAGLGRAAAATSTRILLVDAASPDGYQLWTRPTDTSPWARYADGALPGVTQAAGVDVDASQIVLGTINGVQVFGFDVAGGTLPTLQATLPISDVVAQSGGAQFRSVRIERGSVFAYLQSNQGPDESFAVARRATLTGDWQWDGLVDITASTDRGGLGFSVDGTTISTTQRGSTTCRAYFAEFVPAELDCDGDCTRDSEQIAAAEGQADRNANGRLDACEVTGVPYCLPAPINSTGAAGDLRVIGAPVAGAADLVAVGTRMPSESFAMLVGGNLTEFVPAVGGSAGTLCVGGIRFTRFADAIQAVDLDGSAVVPLDLTDLPIPFSPFAFELGVGSTHYFQMWYRDGGSSNLTNAVAVTRDA